MERVALRLLFVAALACLLVLDSGFIRLGPTLVSAMVAIAATAELAAAARSGRPRFRRGLREAA